MTFKLRQDIQAIRGLAVTAVVLFHADQNLFPNGYLGVDIFFVVSGFVVTPLLIRIVDPESQKSKLSNLSNFLNRRLWRLLPALGSILAVTAVLVFLLVTPSEHQSFARQGIATMILLGNLGAYRYSGNYFHPNPNPLIHTWSLAVEEQIYVFLPLFFILVSLFTGLKRYARTLFALITTISIIIFLYPSFLQSPYSILGSNYTGSSFNFYSPIDRIWEFTIGGLVYFFSRQTLNMWPISKKLHIVFLFEIFVLLVCNTNIPLRVGSILACLITIKLLFWKSAERLPNFISGPLEWLGDRSYSIYLLHMPLLYVAQNSYVTKFPKSENRIVQTILAIFLLIIVAHFSYTKIESRFRKKNLAGTSKKALFTALVFTLTPILVFVTMDIGSKKNYWGIVRAPSHPPAAWELDKKCSRMSQITDTDKPPCVYGNISNKRSVLLIGDSHAAQFSQVVVDAAKKNNWNAIIYTKASCNTVLKVSHKINGLISPDCVRRNFAILEWLRKHNPDLVIISQYNRRSIDQAEVKKMIDAISRLTRLTLVLGNTPVFIDSQYMQTPAILQPSYSPSASWPVDKMDFSNIKISQKTLFQIESKNIRIVNLNYLWCNTFVCNRYLKGHLLFFDNSHLSTYGAEMSNMYFSTFLKSL